MVIVAIRIGEGSLPAVHAAADLAKRLGLELRLLYVATELARSNAYYGAWALASDVPELPLAAATARVSANEAYFLAAKENIQVHGGMGYTWEFDCHLYYRRAKLLSLVLGSTRLWKDRLVTHLETANAPL